MINGAYHILVIAVALWAILTGYRKGFFRQLGAVLAVAFAIVASRMLSPVCINYIEQSIPGFIGGWKREFVVQTFTCGSIYLAVEILIRLITFPLGLLMRVLGSSVLNSIGGALFRMFQYLMVLSIVYNMIVDIYPEGEMTRDSRLHDGNVVEGVMQLAPAVLDFPGGEEVAHKLQIEEAKKIS